MPRNAGDYVKSWGVALIRGAASNPEFTVLVILVGLVIRGINDIEYIISKSVHVLLLCSSI